MRETGNEVAGRVAFDVKSVVLMVFRRMDLASNGKNYTKRGKWNVI